MKHVDELCHPIQPLGDDGKGTRRFKKNKIVEWLVDQRPGCLNEVAVMDFPREDRVQLAQLIGYSHAGFGDLGYVTNDDWNAASGRSNDDIDGLHARIRELQRQLDESRKRMADGLAVLYEKSPLDFYPR